MFRCALMLIAASMTAPLIAQESAFQEKTLVYTGGPYEKEPFQYRLLAPEKVETGKTYPLVVFLHGAGERGEDNEKQLKYLPELMAGAKWRKRFPCFLLAPQCRPGKQWVDVPWADEKSTPMSKEPSHQLRAALQMLDKTLADHPIDRSRIYLTGLSMGGYGSWELAMRKPDLFAAVAPVCGGGDERHAKRIAKLPIWTFHGDKDGAVPVGRSRSMVAALKKAGGKPRYTEYAGAGHNVWNRAYGAEEGVIAWMFEQRREQRR